MATKGLSEKHLDKFKFFKLNIAYYRKLADLSQEQVAERSGIAYKSYQNIENPNSDIACSMEVFMSIADALGVEPYLLMKPIHDEK